MNLLNLFMSQREEWNHLIEWMKLQESGNREMAELFVDIAVRLQRIEKRLDELNERTFGMKQFGPKPKAFRFPSEFSITDAAIEAMLTDEPA